VEFKVLGQMEVSGGAGAIEIRPRMPRAVLAVLVLNANRVVSVDQLIDALWGEDPPPAATGALQAYISNLRRLLEPDRPRGAPAKLLVTQTPGYVLRIDPSTVDAHRFAGLVEQARAHMEHGDHQAARDALQRGLNLWRGAPYADFAFEPFFQLEVSRLSELRRGAYESLMEAELGLGRHAAVVADLERMVAEEPLRERRWELLATALYRSGRQAEALRAVSEARRRLGDELGIDISAPLRQLESDILVQSPSLDWTPQAVDATPGGQQAEEPDRVLFGREKELAQMRAVLDRAWQGEGGLVLISGEPGIGKTRLAEELAAVALDRGAQLAWGRGHEGEGAPAFWPWTQVVRELADVLDPEVFRAALGSGAADIAQVVPEVKEVVPDLEPVAALDPSSARTRLYDALSRFLLRVAGVRPLVLVIDDLHWADTPSVQLFGFLTGQLRNVKVVVVGTYRDEELRDAPALTAVLAALAREPTVCRMTLGGLSPQDVARLLGRLSGDGPSDELVATVSGRTEGNPFFVTELARLIETEGSLGNEVPVRVRDVVRRRLSLLPEESSRLLSMASVVGRGFDLEVVARVADEDLDEAIEHIEAALAARLVTEVPDAVGWYRFSHTLVRDTLYDELSALRRARLHQRVAEALEEHGLAEPSELAHHYWQAAAVVGGAHAALAWADRAAEQALSRLAYEQAEELLKRALTLLQRLPGSRERDRRELDLVSRLWVLLAMTRGRAAEEVGVAAARAADLGRALGDVQQLARALYRLASLHAMRGQIEVSSRLSQELVVLVDRSSDPVVRFLAHSARGYSDLYMGRLREARAHLEEAHAIPEAMYDASLTRVILHHPAVASRGYMAIVLALMGEADRAREFMAVALADAEAIGHPFTSAGAAHYNTWLGSILRDAAHVRDQAEKTVAQCLEGGFTPWAAASGLLLGWAEAVQGRPDEGVAMMEARLAEWDATGARRYRHSFHALLAEGYLAASRAADALRAAAGGLRACEETGERFYEAELYRIQGEALAALSQERIDEAEASMERALAVARDQGATLLERRAAESLQALHRLSVTGR
jgi:predicted ATPase/DNA-binding SARP family transcriptional activator